MESYILMNKNTAVAVYSVRPRTEFTEDAFLEPGQVLGKLPIGFEDINLWIDGRKASKHSAHLHAVMKQMGCDSNEGFIRVTHAATINDTFWIRSSQEKISWEQVSLYQNQFTETISKLAFEGIGLYDVVFSSTSPELACDGSFRKCFRKETDLGEFHTNIFLYKRGGEYGAGLEPYCEQMASEIAKKISPDHAVTYDLVKLHGKTASKCNLFTNEKSGYASFAKVTDVKKIDLQEIFDYFMKIGSEQSFREMLVIDSLCFNQDRHAGNYGVLFDNDALQITQMAPVFDLNISLFPYVTKEEFAEIGDKLLEYAPKLGNDFTRIGQLGMNDILRDRVRDMIDFSFSFRGDDVFPEKRVKTIESIVRRQAQALLSMDKLYTRDVFFSRKAKDLEERKRQAVCASELMNQFADRLGQIPLGVETYISVCDTTSDVQCIVENNSYFIDIDFLSGKISAGQNAATISPLELKENNSCFYDTFQEVCAALKQFMEEMKDDRFSAYFKSSRPE